MCVVYCMQFDILPFIHCLIIFILPVKLASGCAAEVRRGAPYERISSQSCHHRIHNCSLLATFPACIILPGCFLLLRVHRESKMYVGTWDVYVLVKSAFITWFISYFAISAASG